jgi:hypothetical protein
MFGLFCQRLQEEITRAKKIAIGKNQISCVIFLAPCKNQENFFAIASFGNFFEGEKIYCMTNGYDVFYPEQVSNEFKIFMNSIRRNNTEYRYFRR